jgi:hypothetical protein
LNDTDVLKKPLVFGDVIDIANSVGLSKLWMELSEMKIGAVS